MIIIEMSQLVRDGFMCFGIISFVAVCTFIGAWLHSKMEKSGEAVQSECIRKGTYKPSE